MDIRHLETFVQVAKLNSFSKAAKVLGYSQAAITIQIQQLEEELHTTLFERFHKTISLTDKGTLFLTHATEILEAVQIAKKCTCDTCIVDGSLRIGTIESLCTSILPDLIHTYHQQYPDVHISITTDSPKALLEQLHQNQLDVVYFMDVPHFDVNIVKVMEQKEEIVFVCSPSHPLTKKHSITLVDILSQDFVLTEKNESYRALFDQYLAQKKVELHPCMEVGNTDFIIQMIQKGSAVSLLPHIAVAPYIENKTLVMLNPQEIHLDISLQLMYHKHKWLTSQMKAFITLVTQKSEVSH